RALAPSFLNAFLPFLRRKRKGCRQKKVVKVFCLSSTSSVLQPWQKRKGCRQKQVALLLRTLACLFSSLYGFVVSNNKILTNAHVVADHTFVQVRKHGSPTKFKAKVVTVGHDCDLAILKINSKKFWKD
ncbi:hypothetical protein HID58_095837, partial [Brassica napus]